MGGYRVDPDVLGVVDAALADAARRAHGELRALQSGARSLVDGWHGEAGARFAQGWGDWHAGALELLAALGAMAVAVGASGRDYATTEDAVRSTMAAS